MEANKKNRSALKIRNYLLIVLILTGIAVNAQHFSLTVKGGYGKSLSEHHTVSRPTRYLWIDQGVGSIALEIRKKASSRTSLLLAFSRQTISTGIRIDGPPGFPIGEGPKPIYFQFPSYRVGIGVNTKLWEFQKYKLYYTGGLDYLFYNKQANFYDQKGLTYQQGDRTYLWQLTRFDYSIEYAGLSVSNSIQLGRELSKRIELLISADYWIGFRTVLSSKFLSDTQSTSPPFVRFTSEYVSVSSGNGIALLLGIRVDLSNPDKDL